MYKSSWIKVLAKGNKKKIHKSKFVHVQVVKSVPCNYTELFSFFLSVSSPSSVARGQEEDCPAANDESVEQEESRALVAQVGEADAGPVDAVVLAAVLCEGGHHSLGDAHVRLLLLLLIREPLKERECGCRQYVIKCLLTKVSSCCRGEITLALWQTIFILLHACVAAIGCLGDVLIHWHASPRLVALERRGVLCFAHMNNFYLIIKRCLQGRLFFVPQQAGTSSSHASRKAGARLETRILSQTGKNGKTYIYLYICILFVYLFNLIYLSGRRMKCKNASNGGMPASSRK